jgi:hypothetical protein
MFVLGEESKKRPQYRHSGEGRNPSWLRKNNLGVRASARNWTPAFAGATADALQEIMNQMIEQKRAFSRR